MLIQLAGLELSIFFSFLKLLFPCPVFTSVERVIWYLNRLKLYLSCINLLLIYECKVYLNHAIAEDIEIQYVIYFCCYGRQKHITIKVAPSHGINLTYQIFWFPWIGLHKVWETCYANYDGRICCNIYWLWWVLEVVFGHKKRIFVSVGSIHAKLSP